MAIKRQGKSFANQTDKKRILGDDYIVYEDTTKIIRVKNIKDCGPRYTSSNRIG